MQPLQKQPLLHFQLQQLPQKLERILHESALVPPKLNDHLHRVLPPSGQHPA
jgi:hypothetical protein